MKGVAAVHQHGTERPAIGRTAVYVDTVAIVAGAVNRGVTMHDEGAIVARVFEERPPDPDQIGFGLLIKRHLRPHPRMHKHRVAVVMEGRQGFQKIAVVLRHGGHRFGMHGFQAAISTVFDTVRGKGCRAADPVVQVTQIRAQAFVMVVDVRQEARKHAVMVAFQHDPILTLCDASAQVFNHSFAVGSAINQITDVDDRGVIAALIGRNARVQVLQQVKMAVDIANGIASHHDSLCSCGKKRGAGPPHPPGYLARDERARVRPHQIQAL